MPSLACLPGCTGQCTATGFAGEETRASPSGDGKVLVKTAAHSTHAGHLTLMGSWCPHSTRGPCLLPDGPSLQVLAIRLPF